MRELLTPYRITQGRSFHLSDHDPGSTGDFGSKADAAEMLDRGLESLRDEQEKLYAEGTWALLVIFQAMDAAGKDSAIEHVMSGLNPQGCQVSAFKAPSSEELAHDFLWRTTVRLPERGQIGVFNRSYYEEVLVVRVHPELLDAERLPAELVRSGSGTNASRTSSPSSGTCARNGVVILKFFLTSRRRNRSGASSSASRCRRRTGSSRRRRRASAQCWDDYMAAYEDMIRHTATRDAPWFVVPADHKWFTRLDRRRGDCPGTETARSRLPENGPRSRNAS